MAETNGSGRSRKASWAQAITSASAAVLAVVALLQPSGVESAKRAEDDAEASYRLTAPALRSAVEDIDALWEAVHALQLADAKEEGAREARARMRERAASSRALTTALGGGGAAPEGVEDPGPVEEVRRAARTRKPLRERVNLPERLPDPEVRAAD